MNLPNITRYNNTAITLHWLVALLIFAAFPLGVYMHELSLSPTKLQLYSYHKWIGITVLLLAVQRVVWRATHTPPALPDNLPRWQKIASHATHQLLYVLLFVVPLSGWLMSSAKGYKTVWLGILQLPDLVSKNKTLGELLSNVHASLNYLLLALVVLHIAAVLKHRLIDRDDVMTRMLPIGDRK
ncbi:cytochrome b [Gallionella capsiferriformans]|jgi:cytochrome b561|uniref:Cytochrome b/b6 domain n=1 Tax=Gallionella capsiferriformans (strain ES-2) TaxID=395494 RepID=D9SG61_GALCS|nr:cytochrome b [Gallionella capsiferriformans]ADL55508.1 Cytochrome b/b6 domain [Gallionella capsiferriformans ES-2]